MVRTLDLFYPFLEKISKSHKKGIPKKLLSIDPGETTGWAIFIEGQLEDYGHINIIEDGFYSIRYLFKEDWYNYIVVEDYKVYPHRLKEHSLSALITPRVIGAVEYIANEKETKLSFQMAGTAKGFVTNDKLRQWGYWIKGQKHSRDAIRHGCYWLLFGER